MIQIVVVVIEAEVVSVGQVVTAVVVVLYSCNQYTIQEAFKLNYAKVSRTGLNPI